MFEKQKKNRTKKENKEKVKSLIIFQFQVYITGVHELVKLNKFFQKQFAVISITK